MAEPLNQPSRSFVFNKANSSLLANELYHPEEPRQAVYRIATEMSQSLKRRQTLLYRVQEGRADSFVGHIALHWWGPDEVGSNRKDVTPSKALFSFGSYVSILYALHWACLIAR